MSNASDDNPSAPNRRERRGAPRRRFAAPLVGCTDQDEIARLVNISAQGMLIQLDAPLRIGDVREFTFDRGDVRLVVTATIVHLLGVTTDGQYSVAAGVLFREPLTPEQEQILNRLSGTS